MPDGPAQNPLTDPVESWFTQARGQGDQSFPDQLGRVVLALGQGAYDLGKNIVSVPHDVMTGRYAPGSLEQPASQYGVDLATAGLVPELGGEVDPNRLNIFSAWHGTPHRFEPVEGNPFGEFLDEKIGSGEGAQAYGWGHYVAESRGVAKSYRDDLSSPGGYEISLGGVPLITSANRNLVYHPTLHALPDHVQEAVNEVELAHLWGTGDPIEEAQDRISQNLTNASEGVNRQYYSDENRQHLKDAYDWISKNKSDLSVESTGGSGHLLNVSVRPDEHELLDWDSPIHEMDQGVQEKLSNLGFEGPDPEVVARRDEYDDLTQKVLDHTGVGNVNFMKKFVANPDEFRKYVNSSPPDWFRGNPYDYLPDMAKVLEHHAWFDEHGGYYDTSPTGEEIYWQLAQNRGKKGASEFLAQNGIPGIKYLDQMSRDAGKGTSNYVIFDPKDIHITARDGTRLFPVDHDPWTQTVTPVDENPFEEVK